MVKTLLRSALREIRQSAGRYLAILAIVSLGVGFFAGLRACQPDMMATGIKYLEEQELYDFRLLSTLGFTREDVDAFAAREDVTAARGAVYADFLTEIEEGVQVVVKAHSLTEGVNLPKLTAGRMPQAPGECLGDAKYFLEEDLGRVLPVAEENDEDIRELLHCGEYTIVGLAWFPYYLNYERGTSSLGSGSVAAAVYIPEDGFDFEVYHEVFLSMADMGEPYSDAYSLRRDQLEDGIEKLLGERAEVRYDTIYAEAMEKITDAEVEITDGWEEYHTQRADAETELDDAYRELADGESEYEQGQRDYEQGKKDYAQGQKDYADGQQKVADARKELEDARQKVSDGEQELADARKELDDGWTEYYQAKTDAEQELADALRKLQNGETEYSDGLAEYNDGVDELEDAEDEIARGEKEIRDGERELDAAEDELADAWKKLEAGKRELEENEAALENGLEQLAQGEAAYEAGLQALTDQAEQLGMTVEQLAAASSAAAETLQQLNSAKKLLDETRAELNAGKLQLDKGWDDYNDGLAEYEDGEARIAAARRELRDGRAELERGKKELADGRKELADAKKQLEDARRELDDGWKEYNDGRADADREFADAETELHDAEEELADAKEKLKDLKRATTYVLTRDENTGYACFESDTTIVAAVSVVFPVFFFLVAALVCMTTMKRMVDEERTQIGVLKAMGYGRAQIMSKYLFYSGSAALLGSAIGYSLGVTGLPWIIWEIYGLLYGFAPLEYVVLPTLASSSFAAALLCSMGATWLSCRMELKRQASELIRPKTPRAGKRVFLEYISPVWRRLSFLHKVSVRNVLRYRSRLVMMVLGIGGCTALLCTGFGIRDSIAHVADDQFDRITLYDYAVTFQDGQTRESAAAFLDRHGWTEEEALLVHSGSVDVQSPEGSKPVYLVISASDTLEGFLSLHNSEGPVAYPGRDEVVLSGGLAESLGVNVGDTVTLTIGKLGAMETVVSGLCDNYVFNYAYLSAQTYREHLYEDPDFSTLYVMAHEGADPYEEGAALLEDDDVGAVAVNEATRDRVDSMLSRLNYIVLVVVLCAAALAFIVLYNLTNINVTERVREIATIKVLGFYQNEVAAYVFREINILSILGSLAGLGMGKALHAFVMAQIRIDSMTFSSRIAPLSYLTAFVMTLLFTAVISLGMRPRLRRIDMAESLKSIE